MQDICIPMAKRPSIKCTLFQNLVLYDVQSRKLDAVYDSDKYQLSKIIKSVLFLHNNIWHFTS